MDTSTETFYCVTYAEDIYSEVADSIQVSTSEAPMAALFGSLKAASLISGAGRVAYYVISRPGYSGMDARDLVRHFPIHDQVA